MGDDHVQALRGEGALSVVQVGIRKDTAAICAVVTKYT